MSEKGLYNKIKEISPKVLKICVTTTMAVFTLLACVYCVIQMKSGNISGDIYKLCFYAYVLMLILYDLISNLNKISYLFSYLFEGEPSK